VGAGLLWSLVAGYAARLVVPELQGRAIAVAMVGSPLALSLGVPAGTLLGQQIGWRWAFGLMALLAVLLLGWVRWAVLALLLWPGVPQVLLLASVLWGVAFGAVPTLFQTAVARRAGAAADLAQSMLVTGWNLAIAAGGMAGGVVPQSAGARQLAWLPLLLLAVCAAWLWARPKAWL